ncbi:MAG: hypothetical protein JXA60_07185 [Candidatus Coatesbacteria bacterium]|nr:hypothetical protein [Candidatus Coatesbacteria bacterium]
MTKCIIIGNDITCLATALLLRNSGLNLSLILPSSDFKKNALYEQPLDYGKSFLPESLSWLYEEAKPVLLPQLTRVFNNFDKYSFDITFSLLEMEELLGIIDVKNTNGFYKYLAKRINILKELNEKIKQNKSLKTDYFTSMDLNTHRFRNHEVMSYSILDGVFNHRFKSAWLSLPHLLSLSYCNLPGFSDIIALRAFMEGSFKFNKSLEEIAFNALKESDIEILENFNNMTIETNGTNGLKVNLGNENYINAEKILINTHCYKKAIKFYRNEKEIKTSNISRSKRLINISCLVKTRQEYTKLARHNLLLPLNIERYWREKKKEDNYNPPVYLGCPLQQSEDVNNPRRNIIQISFPFKPADNSEQEKEMILKKVMRNIEREILPDFLNNIETQEEIGWDRIDYYKNISWNVLGDLFRKSPFSKDIYEINNSLLWSMGIDMKLYFSDKISEAILKELV